MPSPPTPTPWRAIVAMAVNRVIGDGHRIPWHLPEDFRWFKETTMGGTLVMGRKTFESIGRPLPGRTTLVLSRSGFRDPRVRTAADLGDLEAMDLPRPVFICGGAHVYEAALPRCAELLLTRVKRTVDGDTVFPPFEHLFEFVETIRDSPDFTIERWRNRG